MMSLSVSEVIARDPSFDDDDTADVLSLCDMPLYEDAGDCSFSSSDVSVSSSGDEFFEFSPTYARRGNDRAAYAPPACDSREIIFCGKVIPSVETGSASKRRNMKGVTKKARVRAISYTSARCDKWYMLAFGLARFPSEMAMSEIRRRQGKGKGNRGGAIAVSSECDGRTKGKEGGVGWMLKSLGCSRRVEESGGVVVKASFGCIPRL